MPNCPVCGKDVQATTQYCPACGMSLSQSYEAPSTQMQNYPPGYSYPQQGVGTLATGQLHSHRKYIFGIIAALLVGLIIGGIIGFSFPIAADYTNLTGTVSLGNANLGSPDLIIFDGTIYGNLTSAVLADHSYQVNLPVGDTYSVSIQWFNAASRQFGNRAASSQYIQLQQSELSTEFLLLGSETAT